MKDDEKEAQKARAKSLRQEIAKLTNQETSVNTESDSETCSDALRKDTPLKETPRSFVERRMRELDQQRSK